MWVGSEIATELKIEEVGRLSFSGFTAQRSEQKVHFLSLKFDWQVSYNAFAILLSCYVILPCYQVVIDCDCTSSCGRSRIITPMQFHIRGRRGALRLVRAAMMLFSIGFESS